MVVLAGITNVTVECGTKNIGATDFADFAHVSSTNTWCNLVNSTNVLVGYNENRSVSSAITNRLIIAS
jgi:hypothetical protein